MSSARTKVETDRQLGTTAEQEGRRYLLFAGTQRPPNGGLSDLVDTFLSEEAARRAFREVRLGTASTTSWAQLAVVDGTRGVKPLCWFGIGAEPGRCRPSLDAPAGDANVLAARRPRVSRRVRWLISALVAVAATMVAVLVDNDGTQSPVNRQPAVSISVQEPR